MTTIESLGISIGDEVSWSNNFFDTNHNLSNTHSTVYEIYGPRWWSEALCLTIWPYPVFGLSLFQENYSHDLTINNIHLDGDRWFTDQGEELFVNKKGVRRVRQLDLFSHGNTDPRCSPYPFDPAVDYSDQNHVFHCHKCSRDFNGDKWNDGFANPRCPFCHAGELSRTVIIMEKVIPGKHYWSEYQRSLGFTGYPSKRIVEAENVKSTR